MMRKSSLQQRRVSSKRHECDMAELPAENQISGIVENGIIIHENTYRQRKSDGYFCATDLCKSVGKAWSGYWRNQVTQDFIACLSASNGIGIDVLVESSHGGDRAGTWVFDIFFLFLSYIKFHIFPRCDLVF